MIKLHCMTIQCFFIPITPGGAVNTLAPYVCGR